MELHSTNKYKPTVMYIESLVSKKFIESEFKNSIQGPSLKFKNSKENMEIIKNITSNNEQQKEDLDIFKNHLNYNSECSIDHHLSKEPKLTLDNTHDVQNLSMYKL